MDCPVAHRVKIAMPGHELENLVFIHVDPRLIKWIIPVSGHAHRNLEDLLLDFHLDWFNLAATRQRVEMNATLQAPQEGWNR